MTGRQKWEVVPFCNLGSMLIGSSLTLRSLFRFSVDSMMVSSMMSSFRRLQWHGHNALTRIMVSLLLLDTMGADEWLYLARDNRHMCPLQIASHSAQISTEQFMRRERRRLFFFSSCRARSRLGRSSKRLVFDHLFSHCSRTGEKQKARCLPKSKQNKPKHKHNPKQHNYGRHPEN